MDMSWAKPVAVIPADRDIRVAHASRVSGERVLAVANFFSTPRNPSKSRFNKDCFGATPNQHAETHALPKSAQPAVAPYALRALHRRHLAHRASGVIKQKAATR